MAGEGSGNPDMIMDGVTHQIECLYNLNRVNEARAFLDTILDFIDLDLPHVREMLADAYVMADDVNYFYNWYRQNLSQKEANEGDQIMVYGLLCFNRNVEAREVFDNTFPALTSSHHFTYALGHIPKLIPDKGQRETCYKAILERSQNAIADSSEQGALLEWYEISLQAQYCLEDTSGFEKTTQAMTQTYPEATQRDLNFFERLVDRDNPKWKERKIFGIGLSKTGTTSLSKALTLLNFSTAHWTNPYSHDLLVKKDIPLFESLTDISISYQ